MDVINLSAQGQRVRVDHMRVTRGLCGASVACVCVERGGSPSLQQQTRSYQPQLREPLSPRS